MTQIDLSRYSGPEFLNHWTFWKSRLELTQELFQVEGDNLIHTPVSNWKIFRLSFTIEEWDVVDRISGGKVNERYVLLLAALRLVFNRYDYSSINVMHISHPAESLILPVSFESDLPSNLKELILDTDKLFRQSLEYRDLPIEAVLQRYQLASTSGNSELLIGQRALEEGEQPYSLQIYFEVSNDRAELIIRFDSNRYSSAWISQIADHINEALQCFKDINQSCAKIELLSKSQILKLTNWSQGKKRALDPNHTIPALIALQASLTPDADALVYEDKKLSYKSLNDRSNLLAHHLRDEIEIEEGDRCAIYLEPGLDRYIAMMAILKAGGTYVPIDPDYPEGRIRFLLEDSAPKVLFLHSDDLFLFPDYQGTPFAMDLQFEMLPSLEGDLQYVVSKEVPAYLIYTSGSTGKPKGVLVSHGAFLNTILWRKKAYGFTAKDKVIRIPSFSFDSSVVDIFTPIISGAALVIQKKPSSKSAEDLISIMSEQGITHFLMVPSYYEVIVNANKDLPKSIRVITLAGEALSQSLCDQHFESYPDIRLFNEYGPTENTVCSSCTEIMKGDSVTIGSPIDNTEILVLNSKRKLCPPGIVGEIYLAGQGLAMGYHNDVLLTEEKFLKHPFNKSHRIYRSGDIGMWTFDGKLKCLGRVDDQIKIRGFRVEPGEIESVLREHDDVKNACISTSEYDNKRQLAACIESDMELDSNVLMEFLQKRLPEYMVPNRFLFLEEFPTTPNGKIDRHTLCNLMAQPNKISKNIKKPETTQEEVLVEAFSKITGADQIGTDDDFFSLGGDSIKAIQVISYLSRIGWKVEMEDIFNFPIIQNLATYLLPAEWDIDQSVVTGQYPLSPIQRWMFQNYKSLSSHYNQAVILRFKNPLNESALKKSISAIQEHHDILRSVFPNYSDNNYGLIQNIPFPLAIEIFPNTANIEKESTKLQSQVDIENGPLLRAALFKKTDGDRLLLIVNHLVIDGVSWRILLEDLTSAYQLALAEKKITLPLKSNSFAEWTQALEQFANKNITEDEVRFWDDMQLIPVPELPRDKDVPPGQEKNRIFVSHNFDVSFTKQLLSESHHAYSTEINDLLIAAWGMCVNQWTGQDYTSIQMEGHGREDFGANLNVGRTVGWFTTLFPIVLDISESQYCGTFLKSIKEQLRQIPRKGLGYGLLKWMNPSENILSTGKPSIEFNYLGQFGSEVSSGLFEPATEDTGPLISREASLLFGLGLNGIIVKDSLQINLSYSDLQYKEETIQWLLEQYCKNLRSIVAHCVSKQEKELTPSDMSLSQISQEELNMLETLVEDIS